LTAGRWAWTAISDIFTAVPADATPAPTPLPVDADETFAARLSAQLLRRPGRLVAACLATVLGPAIVAQAIDTPRAAGVQAAEASDGEVPVPVPGDRESWLPLARNAATTCPGLSPAILVAIAHVESSLGVQTTKSSAGAVGPMQFLPSTWAAYGVDGDRDGLSDVMNPVDAVHGAARLLCANGGADPERLASALWNYNHSDDYVRQVIGLARLLPVAS
jgi:soluble lytic murein transglycosylase-like protein